MLLLQLLTNRLGQGVVKDIALFMKHRIDIESFLEWFETRMKTASVEISHQKPDGIQKCIHT